MLDTTASAPLREFCAENLTHLQAALAAGARRIELCDNLAVGGTTPSAGVIAQAIHIARMTPGATVRVIIRPRGGDFVYDDAELAAMEADARAAVRLGADGIVLGCLTPKDPVAYLRSRVASVAAHGVPGDDEPVPYRGGFEIDEVACARLVAAVREQAASVGRTVGLTFHMAFDALPLAAQSSAVDRIAALGFDRILTHGGPAGTPITDNLSRLVSLVSRAKRSANPIVILPGGGITYENAVEVADTLDVHEVHGTKIVNLGGMGEARPEDRSEHDDQPQNARDGLIPVPASDPDASPAAADDPAGRAQ